MSDTVDSSSSKRAAIKALPPGTLIDRRIEIVQPLSLGDYCQVYLARDHSANNRTIAIKILSMLDSDGDGALSQSEFDAGRPQAGAGMPPPPPAPRR